MPLYREVVEAFGSDILGDDGGIDRRKLGTIVFRDAGRLSVLNGLVHPVVRGLWLKWLGEQRTRAAAVVVPLLYEIGDGGNWDRIVCVGAPETDQRARLAERGLTAEEIDERLRAQLPVFEKMDRADHVIYNAGSRELLREQVRRIVKEIVEN